MDPTRFDTLARVLSVPDSRRRVLGLLTAVPVVGSLLELLSPEETEAAGRRQRRKKAHKHGKGRRRKHGNHKKKKPTCTPTTCAETNTTCGSIADGCGTTLDCGPCTCATGCPDCQPCNRDTGQCDPITNGTTCNDGDACTQTDTCQDGVCVSGTPVVCTPLDACHVAGVCDPATGVCDDPPLCSSGQVCDAGQCKECINNATCTAFPNSYCNTTTGTCACTTDCAGKACEADNQCGGTCNGCSPTCTTGTCPDDQTCQNDGTCLQNAYEHICFCNYFGASVSLGCFRVSCGGLDAQCSAACADLGGVDAGGCGPCTP